MRWVTFLLLLAGVIGLAGLTIYAGSIYAGLIGGAVGWPLGLVAVLAFALVVRLIGRAHDV